MNKHSERCYFLARFAYNGDDFHGVQEQPEHKTVLGALRTRIEASGECVPHALMVAARTDRGVSAIENFATFYAKKPVDTQRIINAAEACYDDGLVSVALIKTDHLVHARGSSRSKTYRYTIRDQVNNPCATKKLVWEVAPRLSLAAMRFAARDFVGEKDFSSVRGGGCQAGSVFKKIISINITRTKSGFILVDICGDGFLRKMIRNIMGLLAEIGAGLRQCDEIPDILAKKSRCAGGIMAPASGLCLMTVDFDFHGSKLG